MTITNTKCGPWALDDVYKKITFGYWSYFSTGDPGDKSLWVWGDNGFGELGLSLNYNCHVSSPVQLPGSSWNKISAGNNHVLAIKKDSTLWAWGHSYNGALGNGDCLTCYSSPIQIPGTSWSAISTGDLISYAIKTDNTLWAWGYNYFGQLGQNSGGMGVFACDSPVQIPGTAWCNITGGYSHTLATKTDGTLWAWGHNFRGALGQSNTDPYSSPVQIPGTSWSKTSAWNQISFGLKTDGTLWAWGYNYFGSLGINSSNYGSYKSSPVQVPGTAWSDIQVGCDYAIAKKTNGTLWAWGKNQFGELGINTFTYKSSPVQIPGTEWNEIEAGVEHIFASKTDGTLWLWGNNNCGQLGVDSNICYSSPIQLPGNEWGQMQGGKNNSLAFKIVP